ncbi:MAG: hypothetical protein HQ509_04060 [Candidatus Marinimicrobia bacterium]|nr:hypothetical protein [Candidatus Neomarinimicrobiota bacterium]
MNKLYQIILGILFVGSFSFCQLNSSAIEIGTANSNAIQARGLDVLGLNPANLGFNDNPRINVRGFLLPSISVQLNSNSLTANWINTFLNSGELDQNEIDDLMSVFEDNILEINQTVYFPIVGVQIDKYAFMIKPEYVGSLGLPSDLIRFPFEGLKFGDQISFENGKTVAQAIVPISFATAFEIAIPQLSPFVQNTYVGVGGKLLFGIGYGELTFVDGGILSQPTSMTISNEIESKTALGGFGFALDAGFAAVINDNMKANVSLNNLFGHLRWKNVEDGLFVTEGVFNRSEFEEISNYSNEQLDSLENAMIKVDTTFAGDPLSSKYPAYLLAGFEYSNLVPNLDIIASYRQYFTDELGYSITPRLSVASIYYVGTILPLRAGISMGGPEGFQWSTGFGIHYRFYHFDFGFSQMGGFFNNAKGFALALESSLWF